MVLGPVSRKQFGISLLIPHTINRLLGDTQDRLVLTGLESAALECFCICCGAVPSLLSLYTSTDKVNQFGAYPLNYSLSKRECIQA